VVQVDIFKKQVESAYDMNVCPRVITRGSGRKLGASTYALKCLPLYECL